MEEAKTDVRSDIAIMKRATEKSGVEVGKAEEEKKKQVRIFGKNKYSISSLTLHLYLMTS